MSDEYALRLTTVIAKSRGEAAMNIFLGLLFLGVNVVWLRARGMYIYAFSVIFLIQVVFATIRFFKLRKASPIIAALCEPSTLARVHGWPYAKGKYPPNKVPQFLIATIPSGANVRLKVGDERELRPFIAALREAAPQLDIDVPNVAAPKPAGAAQ